MEKKYDYLIVGSGLFGATFAYLAKNYGKKCLVIDKRNHIGGNIYCCESENIMVHKYGCHIFHTNSQEIWNFVNRFVNFTPYVFSPIANYKGELYNLPFNMNTFVKMWSDCNTPKDAMDIISKQRGVIVHPKNLKEQAISLVGYDVYEKLIKGYTKKQWGDECENLPANIIKRLPIRFTFDNNYFNDIYQGIPIGGYNKLIDGLLHGVEIRLNTNFNDDVNYFLSIADKIIYTGCIDSLFDYELGVLDYRSLIFEEEYVNVNNYQGCAVMNFTSDDVPYTRVIEHKHFDRYCFNKTSTIITKEYSRKWEKESEPFYPINNQRNDDLYNDYKNMSKTIYGDKIIYGGRLGTYKYLDMDDTIESAFYLFNKIIIKL